MGGLKEARLVGDGAGERAALVWPNSSLSSRLSLNAEQFCVTKRLAARGEL
jgi:hypothetical protein